YADLGEAAVDIEQSMDDVANLIGFDIPFDVEVRDDLPPGTPMLFNLDSGRIEIAKGLKVARWMQAQYLMEEVLHGIDAVKPNRTISASSKMLDRSGAIRIEAQSQFERGGPLREH